MIRNKAHLVFPADLLEEIDKFLGKRKRSKFVVEAVRKELRRLKLLTAIEEAAGTWKDEDHPELAQRDTYEWVRELRKENREGLEETLK